MTDNLWEEARALSLLPGGFGARRIDLWQHLLNATPSRQPSPQLDTHPDERQIKLDTDRSFVLYPVGKSKYFFIFHGRLKTFQAQRSKPRLQNELNALLTSIFRTHPKLSYFQGYHDIISVILLTLPSPLQFSCAEKLSLHRLRDSMGTSLEPVLGLLRVLRNLLRASDPEYAEILERTNPLPYPLLSSILTLLSHDMPSLPLIQHLFDFLLCREPIMVVYVCAAIILSRKPLVMKALEDEGDDGIGMIHSLLGGLSDLHTGQKEDERATFIVDTRPREELEPEDIPLPPSDDEDDVLEPPKPRISLPSLLQLSCTLYETHPPSDAALNLSNIMGPQSVVSTWSEIPENLPPDEEAELMVLRPDLIVYPYDPTEDGQETNLDRTRKWKQKGTRIITINQKTAIIGSAVFVLGVAIAVYNTREGSRKLDFTTLLSGLSIV
ncbi:rab-GTPase-TBC domain-containing protein [Flagelloscypha sp. PMI_526]|nr:rab-GTPase-TBC domain-containing protein [Flagelloscypha sp. PMI_526]